MSAVVQSTLSDLWFPEEKTDALTAEGEGQRIAKFGTFADSKSAPIHRWFQYPAGFSYRAVEHALDQYGIQSGQKVYDPFVGTGTTSVVCKSRGIESWGVEAHPFVAKIARTKVRWDYDYVDLNQCATDFIALVRREQEKRKTLGIDTVPGLVRKCYSEDNLRKLLLIRELIKATVPERYSDLFEIALIGTLRLASGAATGWPYIAPKKKIEERDGIEAFVNQLRLCVTDLAHTPRECRTTRSEIIEGDCRNTSLLDGYFDLAFTSPPYLNNYDYADRTRLETYFMGFARSWGEITEKVRTRLVMAATTQVVRGKYGIEDIVCDELKRASPCAANEIQKSVIALSKIRQSKGGKKSYDIMVGQYFNDMTHSLMDTHRVMKKGAKYLLILGDSAPYGIHVPTERYLGEIAVGIGFGKFDVIELRNRGGKWKGNAQRHHVPLRESILVLEK